MLEHTTAAEPITDLRATARITGLWYLALALTGLIGFVVVRPEIYVEGDPTTTVANLSERETLARFGVLLEMGIVVTQALAAFWFYRLLRSLHVVAGVAVAAFGLMNAAAVMVSATFLATAISVVTDDSIAAGGDAAGTVGLLYALSTNAWGMGALFFGLWLIPMGWAALVTDRFPKALGWILIVGGVGYVLSATVDYGLSDSPAFLVNALIVPATVGELWMIGYLLVRGIRSGAPRSVIL